MAKRTITNPADSSALSSSVIRDELQLLENEIADLTSGHDHDGSDSKQLDWDNVWSDAVHDHSSNAEGGEIVTAGIADNAVTNAKMADDAVTSVKIAETGWGTTGGTLNNFVSRTGMTDYDFEVADLTTDDTDQTLDLSSIVPASCVAVRIQLLLRNDSTNSALFICHPDSSTNAYGDFYQRIQVVNQFFGASAIVGVDGQAVKYKASNTTWSTLSLTVTGWWEEAHT